MDFEEPGERVGVGDWIVAAAVRLGRVAYCWKKPEITFEQSFQSEARNWSTVLMGNGGSDNATM